MSQLMCPMAYILFIGIFEYLLFIMYLVMKYHSKPLNIKYIFHKSETSNAGTIFYVFQTKIIDKIHFYIEHLSNLVK